MKRLCVQFSCLIVAVHLFFRRDDALHSARLAVNIAHERLERFNKVSPI